MHGSSLELFRKNDRRRIRKFIFRWLPTNERLKIQTPTLDAACLTCKSPCESHSHFIKCSHNKRQVIKDKWYTDFELFLENERYTPPLVRQLFYTHIVAETSFNKLTNIQNLPSDIQAAHDDQNTIGWDHLPRGRLALKWGNLIATHLSAGGVPEKEMSALVWGRRVVKELFRLVLLIWNSRNEDAHGISNYNESPLTRSRLLHQIDIMQQSNPDVSYIERDFIFRPLPELEKYSVCNLKAWHKQATNIIRASKKRIQTSSQRSVDSYFTSNTSCIPCRPMTAANNDSIPVATP